MTVGGVFWASFLLFFLCIKDPEHPLKKSYSKCLRRTRIRWVIWQFFSASPMPLCQLFFLGRIVLCFGRWWSQSLISSRKWLDGCSNEIRSTFRTRTCKTSRRNQCNTRRPSANTTRELSITAYLPGSKSKDHCDIREHQVFWFCLFCLGTHFFVISGFWFLNPLLWNPLLFGILFCRNPFFLESIFLGNPFFGIHFIGSVSRNSTWPLCKNEKKWEFQKMVVCPFCVETVKISALIFSEPPIGAFLNFLGLGEVHASIQFWGVVCGGGFLQWSWVWLGFGDFERECLWACLEVLQNYDPRAEEHSIQFKRTTILRV